jgi:hypothetical protein
MLRPEIVEQARARGWRMPTIRKLFEALDVLLAVSRCHGEHDGVPMAPAFELTHPLALSFLDKRAPTGLPKRARYRRGKTAEQEKEAQRTRSQHRSADADWRDRVEKLAALGLIHYRPGRGLAKHVRDAAPVPSVYALPIVWEKLKTTGRDWIARALDAPKAFFAAAHWARRDLLWELLTGAKKPSGTYAKRSALARWLGPPAAEAPSLPVEIPARRDDERVQAQPVAEHNAEAREGWGMVRAALDGIVPGRRKPQKARPKMVRAEFPGVAGVVSRVNNAPLLGEELTTLVTSQDSSAPPHERAGIARGFFGSLRSLARSSGEDDKPNGARLHSKRGSGRKSEPESPEPSCGRCADSGELARIAASIPPQRCDCTKGEQASAFTIATAAAPRRHSHLEGPGK